MSKIETLRRLPTPSDVRENVQQLGQMLEQTAERLDQTARQVRDLEQLPSLVARGFNNEVHRRKSWVGQEA